jgi:hypothetical protein
MSISKKPTVAQQKFKINIAKQTCNYCKGSGHRIHAMDEYGVYLLTVDGEQILACPTLLEKDKKKTVVSKKIEDEFPALPGAKTATLSKTTLLIAKGIAGAIADRKKAEWVERKQAKAIREQIKADKEKEKNADMQKLMYAKYGPKWHWQIKDTEEDSGFADHLRYDDEERERREDDAFYYAQKEAEDEWEANYLKERDERLARRVLMTKEEEEQDIWDEQYDDLWVSTANDYYHESRIVTANKREKEEYERNGWPWPPKGP